MVRLPQSLAAWGTPAFADALRDEIGRLDIDALPLQRGLRAGSSVAGDRFDVMVLNVQAAGETIEARVGVFFQGILGGCSCADDPTPVEAQNEYCELQLHIDRRTGETRIEPVPD